MIQTMRQVTEKDIEMGVHNQIPVKSNDNIPI